MHTVAVLTISDKGHAGERQDASGREARDILERHGYRVIHSAILPDERELIGEALRRICDNDDGGEGDSGLENGPPALVLTTGGTGFAVRDVTPEATLDVVERLCPGIPEALRAYSLGFTRRAMLSRAVAGIRKQTLIVNLPGSPKAVRENLEFLLEDLKHGLDILTGRDGECARQV